MKHIVHTIIVAAALAAALCAGAAPAAEPLRLLGRTDVPNFEGDFDHFAADVKGNRLFLAGEEKGTLEIFDLKSAKHLKTVTGLEEPHAIRHAAASCSRAPRDRQRRRNQRFGRTLERR